MGTAHRKEDLHNITLMSQIVNFGEYLIMESTVKTAGSTFKAVVTKRFKQTSREANASIDTTNVVVALAPNGTTLATAPNQEKNTYLILVERSDDQDCSKLGTGLYEFVVVDSEPYIYRLGERGSRELIGLTSSDSTPTPFRTPLGNDMCRNAPNLIQEFCQRFVACAAYDLFC